MQQPFLTCRTVGNCSTIHVVATAALRTTEQLAVVLPVKWVIDTIIVGEAVRALAVVCDEGELIAAGADDNAVVGSKGETDLALLGGGEGDILRRTVVVAGGLQVGNTLYDPVFHLTEMTIVPQNAR